MSKMIHWLLMLSIVLFGVVACEDDPEEQDTPETALALYVMNSGATSLSLVDLETDAVLNDVATLGQWPNQVTYHGGKVYVVNSGTNNIMIFDPDNNFAAEAIVLGDGNNPMNLVIYDDNTAYVACSMSGKVLKVNLTTKTVDMEITAGTGTTGIALADGKIYATNTGFNSDYTYSPGTVTVINGATGAVVTTIDVGLNPQAAAMDPDGLVHVVCTGDWGATAAGAISVINPATDAVVQTIDIGGTPGSIAISESDGMAYLGVWGSGLLSYNWETYAVVNGIDDYIWGSGGSGLTVDTEGNIFISIWSTDEVVKIAPDETLLATYAVSDSPSSLALRIE